MAGGNREVVAECGRQVQRVGGAAGDCGAIAERAGERDGRHQAESADGVAVGEAEVKRERDAEGAVDRPDVAGGGEAVGGTTGQARVDRALAADVGVVAWCGQKTGVSVGAVHACAQA